MSVLWQDADSYQVGASSYALVTSYERDSETNLDTAINRMYSPQLGRFLSADPYRGSYSLNLPQSLNRYSYVFNDSINLADPNGLDAMVSIRAGCVVIGTPGEYYNYWYLFGSGCESSGNGYDKDIEPRGGGLEEQFPFDFKVEWNVPKDQKTEQGELRECGKFNIKITLDNVPSGWIDKINVTRIEPSNYQSNGFRIIGKPKQETKGDKIVFTATVQVGNILSGGGRSAGVGLRVFIEIPNTSPVDPDTVVLRTVELQKYKRSGGYSTLDVRDTIPGGDDTDPFKACGSDPPKD